MNALRLALIGAVGVLSLGLAGCSSVGQIVDRLPRGTFEELTYSRAGNTTTADIHLTGVVADDLQFKADTMDAVFTNPLLGKTTLKAKGYVRQRAVRVEQSTGGLETPPRN